MASKGISLPRPATQPTFASEFCGGFQLALICARLSDKQDINARPMRTVACASRVVALERDPAYRNLAGSHPPTPSLQPSPKVHKARIALPGPEGAAQL